MQRINLKAALQKGFTLIELLVVIGILGILMAVVIVAVNPSRQFAQARDTQRKADLSALTSAVVQYSVDHNGNLPTDGTPPTPVITTSPVDVAILSPFLVPDYIAAVPSDPTPGQPAYTIMLDANNRLVASASSEQVPGTYITITR
jgi:prepilin-type N-terminal cleavage/methylation domain-containing protein